MHVIVTFTFSAWEIVWAGCQLSMDTDMHSRMDMDVHMHTSLITTGIGPLDLVLTLSVTEQPCESNG